MPDWKSHSLQKTNMFHPTPLTPLQQFLRSPVLFIATWLYAHQPPLALPLTPLSQVIRVVCISDTHNETPDVPDGDILIHAGDLTQNGTFAELQAQIDWLRELPHAHKIVIAGNHDLVLGEEFVAKASERVFKTKEGRTKAYLKWGDIVYLENTTVAAIVQGREVRIFGSPLTPKYGNWAFQYPQGKDVWQNRIPLGSDIVVTHGPIKGHLDWNGTGHEGCLHLNSELRRVKPRLAVCGHIHEARGRKNVRWDAVQRMYDAALGCHVGRFGVCVIGVLAWVWRWVGWVFGTREEATTTLVNASTVGHWGVASGVVVEI